MPIKSFNGIQNMYIISEIFFFTRKTFRIQKTYTLDVTRLMYSTYFFEKCWCFIFFFFCSIIICVVKLGLRRIFTRKKYFCIKIESTNDYFTLCYLSILPNILNWRVVFHDDALLPLSSKTSIKISMVMEKTPGSSNF